MGKLVNLGSLCIDHVYSVPDITGAGETVASLGHEVFPGGKGLNQSVAAARAGASVMHFGCVGEDGSWLKDVLRRRVWTLPECGWQTGLRGTRSFK